MKTISTQDRWKHNIPCRRVPQRDAGERPLVRFVCGILSAAGFIAILFYVMVAIAGCKAGFEVEPSSHSTVQMRAEGQEGLSVQGQATRSNSQRPTADSRQREAVHWLEGCTGFFVHDDLLVTAKHCEYPREVKFPIGGEKRSARQLELYSGEDGPAVYFVEGGPYPSLPVATEMPEVGEQVTSLGFPGGHWAETTGVLSGGNGIDVNHGQLRLNPGNSGGPLLNSRGEVIGVALHVADDLRMNQSGFSGWQVTREAIDRARQAKFDLLVGANDDKQRREKSEVVVFTSQNCPPCQALKTDIRAGHFDDYQMTVVTWDEQAKAWSRTDLYREFWTSADPNEGDLGFPVIWIRGTASYRVGYDAQRRGGLLGWLGQVCRTLKEGLVGRDPPPQFPLPDPADVEPREAPHDPGDPRPYQRRDEGRDDQPAEVLQRLRSELAALRSEVPELQESVEAFQRENVIGKLRQLPSLRRDANELQARLSKVRSDVEQLRSGFRDNPLQTLWGLVGLLTGAVHRRYA